MRVGQFLSVCALVCLGACCSTPAPSLTLGAIRQCDDGNLHTDDPTCASYGSGVDFAFSGSIPSFQNLTEDTDAIYFDVGDICTGTDCGSVTYSLVAVPGGDDCTMGQMSIADGMDADSDLDELIDDGTEAEDGSCRVKMAYSGVEKLSNIFAWQFITGGPVSDTTAPTVTTDLAAVGISGGVRLTWRPSMDDISGIDHYLLKNASTEATLATVTSGVVPGLTPTFTSNEIGTFSGTPVYGITGLVHTINCPVGTGMGNTDGSDEFCAEQTAVSGDFSAQFCPSFNDYGDADYPMGGMWFKESEDDGSRGIFIERQDNQVAPVGQIALVRVRQTQDANAPALINTPWSGACMLVVRTGSTWDIYGSDAVGGPWYRIGTPITFAANDALVGGTACASGTSTMDPTECQFSEVGITNAPSLSYDYMTGATLNYEVAAVDASSNQAADSASVSSAPGVPSSGTRKYHPGIYLHTLGRNSTNITKLVNTIIPEVAAMNTASPGAITGLHVKMVWSQFETTEGNYNMSAAHQILDAAEAAGLRLVIHLLRTGESYSGVPDYLEAACTYVDAINDVVFKIYLQDCATAYINLEDAIGAEFDSEPYFEGFAFTETAVPDWQTTGDYTGAGMLTQMLRIMDARELSFPTSGRIFMANAIGDFTQSRWLALIDEAVATGQLWSGPDIIPKSSDLLHWLYQTPSSDNDYPRTKPSQQTLEDYTNGQCYYIGADSTDCPDSPTPGHDYRDDMVYYAVWESPEMGGKSGNFTTDELFGASNDVFRAAYISPDYKEFDWCVSGGVEGTPGSTAQCRGPDEVEWTDPGQGDGAQIKTFGNGSIRSLKQTIQDGDMEPDNYPACPPNYPEGCS